MNELVATPHTQPGSAFAFIPTQAGQAQPNYALVIPEVRDFMPDTIIQHPLVPDLLQGDAEQMPALIVAEELSEAAHAWLARRCAGPESPVSAAWYSESPAYSLIDHYKDQQVREHPNGEKRWLRLHDPRVVLQMRRILDNPHQQQLFGPITDWWICLHGKWSCMQVQPTQKKYPSPEATWQAIDRIGLVNRCFEKVGFTSYGGIVRDSQIMDDYIVKAQDQIHQLIGKSADTDDVVMWVYVAAKSQRQDFYTNVSVQKMLKQAVPATAAAGTGSQTDAAEVPPTIASILSTLNQADFDALRNELS